MAYGFRNNATAVNDGGSRKRTEQEQQQALAEAQRRANDEWAKQQAEADWAARMEEQRRQERVEAQNYSAPAPQPQQTTTNYPKPNPQKRDAQRAADQAAAQQDAQNNAWKNIIDYSEPSALTSNGQTITNQSTGQTYVVPNRSQQMAQQQEEPTTTARKYESNGGMVRPQNYMESVPDAEQEAVQPQTTQQQKGGNLTVPEGYVTRPSSTNSVTAGTTPSRDYTDEEISQMQRDRGNLVVPRSYNPMDQNKESNAGLPSARDEDEDQLGAWRVLQNTPDSSDTPDNDWGQVIDNGSALAGTNYNAPYDFTRYQDYVSRGYSDDQAKDAARRDYTAPTTTKVQPNSAVENDFFYQLAISEGATPEEALEYMGEMYELADNAPTYNSFGDFIVNGVLNGAEGRERLADANQKIEDLYENIPDNPYLGNPDAAIDHYIENGGPERDAAFKAWYRNTRNDFTTANQKNDVAQDYINAQMAMDGKTKADYSPKEWFKLEAEANAYAEEQVNTPSKTTPEYQLEQINNRRNQDNATLADVVEQLDTVGQNTPTTSEMEQVLEDLGINRPAGYMPYGDPRQGNNTGTGNGTANPSTTSGNATPNTSGGYNQNVVDYMNANGNGTPQRQPDVAEPSSSGGGVLNDIVDFFTGNNYKYNEDGTVSKVDETPESKQDRLARETAEAIANGSINNVPETNGQTGIEDVIDNIMTGDYQPETDEEKRKRLENVNNYLAENGYTPEAYNDLEKRAILEDMNNYLRENGYTPEAYNAYQASAYNGGTSSGSPSGSSSGTTPKGSETYRPSYGQDGQVVKAPYKTGGYTEQELMDMGNHAWGEDRYNNNMYEGYYRAPDGHYYPVDQEKAEYYKRYGTYNGWQEPMRDYYNTFGTFSGYTPTWRSTGRNYGGGRSYSYSGGSRSSSGYYGGNNYSGNYNSNVQPELTNQTRQRINNIMRNWTF